MYHVARPRRKRSPSWRTRFLTLTTLALHSAANRYSQAQRAKPHRQTQRGPDLSREFSVLRGFASAAAKRSRLPVWSTGGKSLQLWILTPAAPRRPAQIWHSIASYISPRTESSTTSIPSFP